jgi:hypothetical protein
VLTKDRIHTLDDIVVVDPTYVDLFPQSCTSQGFVDSNVVQAKNNNLLNLLWAQKQPRLWDFLNQNKDKSRPNFPNLDRERRKQKQKHDMCEIKIQQDFIARKK